MKKTDAAVYAFDKVRLFACVLCAHAGICVSVLHVAGVCMHVYIRLLGGFGRACMG